MSPKLRKAAVLTIPNANALSREDIKEISVWLRAQANWLPKNLGKFSKRFDATLFKLRG
jgi:hypothetical protein